MRHLIKQGALAVALASTSGCRDDRSTPGPAPAPDRSAVLDPAAATWADMLERMPIATTNPEAAEYPAPSIEESRPEPSPAGPQATSTASLGPPSPAAPTRTPTPSRTPAASPEATRRPTAAVPAPIRSAPLAPTRPAVMYYPPQVYYGPAVQPSAGYYLVQPRSGCPGGVCPR